MANLETAVQDLAVALDELSAKVELQKLHQTEITERAIEQSRQIDRVDQMASAAARDLAAIIKDLKILATEAD